MLAAYKDNPSTAQMGRHNYIRPVNRKVNYTEMGMYDPYEGYFDSDDEEGKELHVYASELSKKPSPTRKPPDRSMQKRRPWIEADVWAKLPPEAKNRILGKTPSRNIHIHELDSGGISYLDCTKEWSMILSCVQITHKGMVS